MGEVQMVAYNPTTKQFLKKHKNTWITTDNLSVATGYPLMSMQLAVAQARKHVSGDWMIMRRQDADKLIKNKISQETLEKAGPAPVFSASPEGVSHPLKVEVKAECPPSPGSSEILSLVSRLEAATSANRLGELQAQVSEYDKMISEIYHYIEAKKLNAAQGYKAYKNLRGMLLRRRALKNELYIVNQFRSGTLPNAEKIDEFSQRLWSPDIEELMSR